MNVLASFGVYPNALAHVTKSTRPSLKGQRSYVKIVRGERGPGNEAMYIIPGLLPARIEKAWLREASKARGGMTGSRD